MASTHPSEFLPVRRQADRQEPLGEPTVLDALDLGRGRWVLVLEVSRGSARVCRRGGTRGLPPGPGG